MKIAIIGLPQAGKRTLFTLLTGRSAPEGRKPEETIEGIAWVRDPRIDALTDIFQPKKSAYAENQGMAMRRAELLNRFMFSQGRKRLMLPSGRRYALRPSKISWA